MAGRIFHLFSYFFLIFFSNFGHLLTVHLIDGIDIGIISAENIHTSTPGILLCPFP